MKIGIIDYGVGNLLSLMRAVEHVGAQPALISTAESLSTYDKVILPGVGAFPYGMERLHQQQLVTAIQKFASQGKFLLGICLGMQLLFDRSTEFKEEKGLSILSGDIKELPDMDTQGNFLKKPNIGWLPLQISHPISFSSKNILDKIPTSESFYFVHSFSAHPTEEECIVAKAPFGSDSFTAVVQSGNIFGCQFHPEKSGPSGLKILENFLSLS